MPHVFRFGLALALGPAVLAALVSFPAASQEPEPQAADSAYELMDVEVTTSRTGQGRARAVSAVDSTDIKLATPGTSALKVIERLPGVNFQSSDVFGVYEWANRVTIRGFQTQQIGQTFDGIPLGDMSYGNFNGLGIGRAVDPDNLAMASVAQGSGALGVASANNLGGAVQYVSDDPASRLGGRVRQLVGEADSRRTYGRFDSGLLLLGANAGFKGYVSVARTDNDKWKGGGERFSTFPGNSGFLFGEGGFAGTGQNWQDQLNTKLNLFVGSHRFTAFYNYSDKKESDYMDLSLSVLNNTVSAPGLRFGPNFDYLPVWSQAQQLAELSSAEYNPLTDAAYFFSAQGARQDHLAYLRGDFQLGAATTASITPYLHTNRGGGDWHAPSYGASYSPDPIMFRQTQYRSERFGALGRVTSVIGNHRPEAGVWLEDNTARLRRPRWRLVNYAAGPAVDYGNVLRLDFDRTGDIRTVLAYVQNTTLLLQERLRLTYGAKYVRVNADFRSNGNTPTDGVIAPIFADEGRPDLSVPTDAGILPQAGAVFALTPEEEIFAGWAENVNQFSYSPQSGIYNAAPSTFDFFRETARPERSSTFELGARTRRAGVEAALTLYAVDYRNRLLGIAICPATVTCATGFGNVGSVTTRGVEALVAVDVLAGLQWSLSGSYNASTFDDDYLANQNDPASVVRTSGKDVQNAPRVLASSNLRFTRGGLGLEFGGRYVDKRFFTYTNDLEVEGDDRGLVPSYTLLDASASYRFPRIGAVRDVVVQLNVHNVFDRAYVSSIGTNGFGATGDNTTLLTGPGRLVFAAVGVGF